MTVKTCERGTFSRTVQTNETGTYSIVRFQWGIIRLKVEKTDFKLPWFPTSHWSLNQIARIDVTMKVGQVSEIVEVTGAAPVLKTEYTQVDTIIDAATNERFPSRPETTSN